MSSNAEPRHSVSVAAVVVDEHGRALVTRRRDTGKWEPPGGVLELDEAVEDGLRREVREETGLAVEVERLTGVYKNMARGIVALVFRCAVVGGELGATEEVDGFQWVTADELARWVAEGKITEAFGVRLLDGLYEDLSVKLRNHDGVALTSGGTVR